MSKMARAGSVSVADLLGGLDKGRQSEFKEQLAVASAGLLVRQLRQKSGLTQQQLAERIGSPQMHISNIERGQGSNGPTVATLARIAEACGEELVVSTASLEAGKLSGRPDIVADLEKAVDMARVSKGVRQTKGRRITVMNEVLVGQVANAARISSPSAIAAVDAVVEYVQLQIQKGNTVRIPGVQVIKRNRRFGSGKGGQVSSQEAGVELRHPKRKPFVAKHPPRRET